MRRTPGEDLTTLSPGRSVEDGPASLRHPTLSRDSLRLALRCDAVVSYDHVTQTFHIH